MKINVLFRNFFFFERAFYYTSWKNTVEPGKLHTTIWRMLINISCETSGMHLTVKCDTTTVENFTKT
jgi:hypothetical protein